MPKILLIIIHFTTYISSLNLMQLDLKRSPHMTAVSQSRKHVVAWKQTGEVPRPLSYDWFSMSVEPIIQRLPHLQYQRIVIKKLCQVTKYFLFFFLFTNAYHLHISLLLANWLFFLTHYMTINQAAAQRNWVPTKTQQDITHRCKGYCRNPPPATA